MAELTKEQKKAIRREKIKAILKNVGIGLGIAAVSGGTAYLIGKTHGQLSVLKTETMNNLQNNLRADGAQLFLTEVADKLMNDAKYATELTLKDTGAKKYINYSLSDTAPEWWNTPESKATAASAYEIVNK